jgi:hypothetical protein
VQDAVFGIRAEDAERRVGGDLRIAACPDRIDLLGDVIRPVRVVGEAATQNVSDEGGDPKSGEASCAAS